MRVFRILALTRDGPIHSCMERPWIRVPDLGEMDDGCRVPEQRVKNSGDRSPLLMDMEDMARCGIFWKLLRIWWSPLLMGMQGWQGPIRVPAKKGSEGLWSLSKARRWEWIFFVVREIPRSTALLSAQLFQPKEQGPFFHLGNPFPRDDEAIILLLGA